jgi:hypothetical protein
MAWCRLLKSALDAAASKNEQGLNLSLDGYPSKSPATPPSQTLEQPG